MIISFTNTHHTTEATPLKTVEFNSIVYNDQSALNNKSHSEAKDIQDQTPNGAILSSDGQQSTVNENYNRPKRSIIPFRPLFVYRLFEEDHRREEAEKRKLAQAKSQKPKYYYENFEI